MRTRNWERRGGFAYTINEADIELNVAISIESQTSGSISAEGNIAAFSVNASYTRTYGFKEEASSPIRITLAAKLVRRYTVTVVVQFRLHDLCRLREEGRIALRELAMEDRPCDEVQLAEGEVYALLATLRSRIGE